MIKVCFFKYLFNYNYKNRYYTNQKFKNLKNFTHNNKKKHCFFSQNIKVLNHCLKQKTKAINKEKKTDSNSMSMIYYKEEENCQK